MVYIYKLENELGVYIGSSVDPNKRYNTHLSLLRNEKHYNKKLTEMYKNGRKKDIDYKSFLEIIEMLQEGYTNKDIATVFGIDPSVVSRIKNKKIYREHFDKMSGSTTIEKIAKART